MRNLSHPYLLVEQGSASRSATTTMSGTGTNLSNKRSVRDKRKHRLGNRMAIARGRQLFWGERPFRSLFLHRAGIESPIRIRGRHSCDVPRPWREELVREILPHLRLFRGRPYTFSLRLEARFAD